jgi:hypothetical protein
LCYTCVAPCASLSTIFDFVKEQRNNYRTHTIEIADGYEYSQYERLRTIELYHNSKFLTGNKDSLKREKPFYNITKFRVNVATRATDILVNIRQTSLHWVPHHATASADSQSTTSRIWFAVGTP